MANKKILDMEFTNEEISGTEDKIDTDFSRLFDEIQEQLKKESPPTYTPNEEINELYNTMVSDGKITVKSLFKKLSNVLIKEIIDYANLYEKEIQKTIKAEEIIEELQSILKEDFTKKLQEKIMRYKIDDE